MSDVAQSPELIRNQLQRILASKLFRSSELQKQFLTFVVCNTLDGKASEIKEYAIGADAFGRGQDFDPRIDSVVRVVARRVRDRLSEFYRHEGKADPIVITLSSGSYIPTFSSRPRASAPASPKSPSPSPTGITDELIGATISHYEILELMTRGGSGLVYRAEDLRLKRGVAFKVLFPEFASDAGRLERFLREARAASAVSHPNLCAIYDFGEYQGRAYIAMELVLGKTLDRFIDGKPLEIETILNLGIQLSDALLTVHSQGIIHRDVRSANIIVNSQGHAKLLDFSAAEAVKESPDNPFAAPEAKQRPDLIGLGKILYEMATGTEWSKQAWSKHEAPHPPTSILPAELGALIAEATAADGAFRDIGEIRAELVRIRETILRPPPPLSGSHHRWIWLASALGALLLAMLLKQIFFGAPPRSHITRYTQLTRDGQGKVVAFLSGGYGEVVTDGPRIYFSAISGTRVGLSQVASVGGETAALWTDLNRPLIIKDIAPDSSKLLVTGFYRPTPDLPLLILPLPGDTPQPLGNLVGHDAAWSPDGSRVAYSRGNDIYIADAAGSNSRKLVHCPALPIWLKWSPDAKSIRFTMEEGDISTSLWEVSSEGANLHSLMNADRGRGGHHECCGSWSPDGRFFIFQASSNGRNDLYLIPAARRLQNSPAPMQLTDGPLSFSSPVFSRDGKRILAIGTQRRGELVRYDATRKEFTPFLAGISADHLEFSRDRRWIAYSSYPEAVLWKSRVDGTDRLQLSPAGMTAWSPQWSPDGRRLAFIGSYAGGPLKTYLISAAGGSPELLMPGPDSDVDPNWSPDGQSIMFGTVPTASGPDARPPSIRTMDLRTRTVSTLPGSEGLREPRWSPDGQFVIAEALARTPWRDPGVFVFNFKARQWSPFLNRRIDNNFFSADGQYYYFDEYEHNDPAIFRVRMSDRALERVAGLKEIRRSLGVLGWWMGLSPDGSPMVLRDTSIEEIYALDFQDR